VYLAPVLGGYLADPGLGLRRAVIIGAIVMALGHFAMAVPSLLNIRLGLLIAGNGFFKGNRTALVGALYPPGDARCDAGYTVLAPLVAGTLGETWGWHWGFTAAGVGMVAGLIVFLAGQGRLGRAGLPAGQARLGGRDWGLILGFSAVTTAGVAAGVTRWPELTAAWGALGGTDRDLFGWEMPATDFQSINPLLILLLAPGFAVLWSRWDHSRFVRSAATKQGLGMIILGLGFAVLAAADARAEAVGPVSPLWLLAVYALHTTGELFLSPIGLSMVSRLAPARIVSLMMGIWFIAFALANDLAGNLKALLAETGLPLYGFLVMSSVGAGVLLILLSPFLRWLADGYLDSRRTTAVAPAPT